MPIDASAITIAGDSASGLTNTGMAMATPLAQTKSFKPVFARLLASFFGSAAPTASEPSLPPSQSAVKATVKQQAAASANRTSTDHGAATVEQNSLPQLIPPFQAYDLSTNSWTAPSLWHDALASGSPTVQQEPAVGSEFSVPENDLGRIQGTLTATGTALSPAYTTTTALPEGTLPGLSTEANSGTSAATPSAISSVQLDSYSSAVAPMAQSSQGTPSGSALSGQQTSEGDKQDPSTTSIQSSSVPWNPVAASGTLQLHATPFGQPDAISADSSLNAGPLLFGAAKQGPETVSRNIVSANPAPMSSLNTSDNPGSAAANRDGGAPPLSSPSSMEIPPSPVGENVPTNAAEFSQLLSNLADQVAAVIISHTVPDAISGLTEEVGTGTSQSATPEPLPAASAGTIPLSTVIAPETQDRAASQPLPIGSAAAKLALDANDGSTADASDVSNPFATGALRSTAASNQPHPGVRGSNRLAAKAMTAELVSMLSDHLIARASSPTTTGGRSAGSDASVPGSSQQVDQPESKLPASTAPAVFVSEHAATKDSSALASSVQLSGAQQSSNQTNTSPSVDSSRASDAAKDSTAGGNLPNAATSDLAALAQIIPSPVLTSKLESAATSANSSPNVGPGGSNEAVALASIVAHRAAEPVELSPAMQAWNGGENLPSRLIQAARLGGNLREAEMNIAMQSDSLGAVEMHARVSGDVVGATIGVERHDAHAVISNDLYALHQALEERQLRVGNVTVVQHDSSMSNTTANDGERPRQQRSANPPAPFEGDSNIGQPSAPAAAVETVESLAMRMIFDSQGRLSVRA